MNDPILKEKAVQILNTFSEEQLNAFITLFGGLNGDEPPNVEILDEQSSRENQSTK